MTLKDFRMPEAVCPECNEKLDAATETIRKGRKPGPGDFSVCAYCAAVLRFDESLRLRTTTIAERSEQACPEIEHAVQTVLLINQALGRKAKR